MKKKSLLLIFTILYFSNAFAQTYTYYGSKVFGSDQNDHSPMLFNEGNGTLILAGTSFGNVSGDKTEAQCDSIFFGFTTDIWLVKIDTAFNILWNKSYGGNAQENEPFIIESRISNRLMLTCTSASDSSCEKTTNCKKAKALIHKITGYQP